MSDFSANHIDSAFSRIVIDEFQKKITRPGIEFFPGVSYRHIMIWREYPYDDLPDTTPPHDIQGEAASGYYPCGTGSSVLAEIMDLSKKVIADSAAIRDARSRYQGAPVSAWLWGAGRKPTMKTLNERFGLYGHTISAVDLIHGIGRAAGLTPLCVEGATGYLDTNYTGKADALLCALDDANFVFLHVESPDESGHEGNIAHKIQAIEDFDEKVVGRVMKGLKKFDDVTLLVMPDHPTPIALRTHASDPVPFCIFREKGFAARGYRGEGVTGFNEVSASGTGIHIEEAHRLIEIMREGGL